MNILDYIGTTPATKEDKSSTRQDLYTVEPEQVYSPPHSTDIDSIHERLNSSSPQKSITSFTAEEAPLYAAAKTTKPKKRYRCKPPAKPASPPSIPKYDKTTPFNPDDFFDSPYRDAAYFIKLFKPFTRRYLKRITYGGHSQWIVQPSPLSFKRIQSTITKGHDISWFSSFRTPALGIDIDFHELPSPCWQGNVPNPHLEELYGEIIYAFDHYPSLICRSPRGLHIYYLLKNPMEYSNLKLLAEDRLSHITSHIEIKPSPNTGLRIPVKKWILDPESFKPIGTDTPIKWESINQFDTDTLFGPDYRQTLSRLNFTKPERTEQPDPQDSLEESELLSRKEKYKRMLTAERELLPFTNGRSNEILCQLIPKYKAVNFSVQSIIERLQYHISSSPGYTNDLTDPYILERRVIDILNMKSKTFQPASPKITELPEHLEEIIKKHTFPKQRTKGIRQYFLGLLNWKALHDRSLTDFKFRSRMDDMYPYYWRNRKLGFYPLPSKVQKSWNKNYNSLLPWLKEMGILVESGFKYSPGAHICKYYEIYLDLFRESLSEEQAEL